MSSYWQRGSDPLARLPLGLGMKRWMEWSVIVDIPNIPVHSRYDGNCDSERRPGPTGFDMLEEGEAAGGSFSGRAWGGTLRSVSW